MDKKRIFSVMLVFIMALGLAFTGCATTPTAGSQGAAGSPSAAGSQSAGPQLRVTVTGIPAEYVGKLGWLQMDTGPTRNDPTVTWAMGNISSGSLTLSMLDWTTDQPYNRTGNYYVSFFIWEDLDAAGAPGVPAL